jgi:arylsulfatase A-like enzyme
VPTLAAVLRGAGYATQAVTSHLYVSETYGLADGFEHLDFQQDRKATEVVERAIDRLDRLGDRPFFLFLHFYDPHWHYDPPADRLALFETSYTGQLTGLWQDFSRRDPRRLSPADLAHLLALYDGEIRYVDDELGRLLDHVKARGLDRGTLLVVTSDHGEEFLDHGSWEHQKTLYEEVVRVPLVVAGPGVVARREPAQATLLDVAPTILAWAGVPAVESFEGRSLLAPLSEREAYGETDHTMDRSRKLFVRAGAQRWKAILSLSADGRKLLGEEWYDLAVDPRETHPGPPSAAAADAIRLRAIERWRSDRTRGAGAPEVALTEEQRERLRALGYVGN